MFGTGDTFTDDTSIAPLLKDTPRLFIIALKGLEQAGIRTIGEARKAAENGCVTGDIKGMGEKVQDYILIHLTAINLGILTPHTINEITYDELVKWVERVQREMRVRANISDIVIDRRNLTGPELEHVQQVLNNDPVTQAEIENLLKRRMQKLGL